MALFGGGATTGACTVGRTTWVPWKSCFTPSSTVSGLVQGLISQVAVIICWVSCFKGIIGLWLLYISGFLVVGNRNSQKSYNLKKFVITVYLPMKNWEEAVHGVVKWSNSNFPWNHCLGPLKKQLGVVVHACNSSASRGWSRRSAVWDQAQHGQFDDFVSKWKKK